jgi:hypothetical protein
MSVARPADWTFRYHVRLRPWETPDSFAARVAHTNGFGSPKSFLRLMAIRRDELYHGKQDAIERLARHAGVRAEALGKYAARPLSVRAMSFANSHWHDKAVSRSHRFCPMCVAEDLDKGQERAQEAVYVRAFWNLTFMGRCAIHGCDLRDMERVMSEDLGTYVRINSHLVPEWASQAHARPPNAFDAYLARRMEEGPAGIWLLDGLELGEALLTCETVGLELDKTAPITQLSLPERDAVRDRGFLAIKDGADGLREYFDKFIPARRDNNCGATQAFAGIYRFAQGRLDKPEYAEFIDTVGDYGARNFPLAAGDMFLRKVPRRYVHSVKTAGWAYALEPNLVRKIVTKIGLIGQGDKRMSDSATVFSADAADPHLKAASDTVTVDQAAKILGVDAWKVYEIGCVFAITPGNSLKHAKPGKAFSEKKINELVDALHKRVNPNLPKEGLVGLMDCEAATLVPFQEVLRLLNYRKLYRVSRNPAVPGLPGLLLSPAEILEVMAPVLRTDYASLALGTSHEMSKLLITSGLLKTTVGFNSGQRLYERFPTPEQLIEFRSEYASLVEIAVVNGNSASHQAMLVAALGLEAVCAVSDVVAFYRRDEIVAAMGRGQLRDVRAA